MSDLRTRIEAWFWGRPVKGEITQHADQVLTMLRDLRLVVIDPEGRDINRLIARLGTAYNGSCQLMRETLAGLHENPKPDEPTGLGAVVEDDRGVLWVRTESAKGIRNPWQATLNVAEPDDIRQLSYAEIAVVRALSEGIDA